MRLVHCSSRTASCVRSLQRKLQGNNDNLVCHKVFLAMHSSRERGNQHVVRIRHWETASIHALLVCNAKGPVCSNFETSSVHLRCFRTRNALRVHHRPQYVASMCRMMTTHTNGLVDHCSTQSHTYSICLHVRLELSTRDRIVDIATNKVMCNPCLFAMLANAFLPSTSCDVHRMQLTNADILRTRSHCSGELHMESNKETDNFLQSCIHAFAICDLHVPTDTAMFFAAWNSSSIQSLHSTCQSTSTSSAHRLQRGWTSTEGSAHLCRLQHVFRTA